MFNSIKLGNDEKLLFKKLLSQTESEVALLEKVSKNNELVGIAGVIYRYVFLPSFFLMVSEKHENKGFGKQLTKKVLNSWNKPLFLTVPVGNKPAIHIYEKFGFRKIMPWRRIRGNKMQLMLKL